jgi:hypothetical protein
MRWAVLAMLAACGGGPLPTGDDIGMDGPGSGSGVYDGLVVIGNQITLHGARIHGRGADFHDTRSCNACSFMPADPDGVDRWADELIDHWHANLIRFLLASKAAPYNQYEQQWMNLVDDAGYYADIQTNVAHMTSKGAYVIVTLFADPTIKDNNAMFDSEWPSSLGDSTTRYTKLAEAFADNSHVLFGLTNEPHTEQANDGMTAQHEAALAAVYANAIAAIRTVEDAHHVPHHIVVVQAPIGWARDLAYFVAQPLAGDQIAYEIHPYNPTSDFDHLIVQPSQTLPVIIGEYGEAPTMSDLDIMNMWAVAEANEVPYIVWNFHARCPPNLLMDTASDGCGLAASTGYMWPRTPFGDLVYGHFQTPW